MTLRRETIVTGLAALVIVAAIALAIVDIIETCRVYLFSRQFLEELPRRFTGAEALRAYRTDMAEGMAQGRRPELIGGGLVRSLGGVGGSPRHAPSASGHPGGRTRLGQRGLRGPATRTVGGT